jgi:predicted SnoaL-like aldol condensation-catalyzing enzyme
MKKMNYKLNLTGLLLAIALISSCSKDDDEDTISNAEKTKRIINSLSSGDTQPINDYISDNPVYKQHNLNSPDGKAAVLSFQTQAKAGGLTTSIQRTFTDGSYVFTHTQCNNLFGSNQVSFDVFRYDANGKAVEHWDNLQAIASNNPGGHSLIDGSTTLTDLNKTEANRTLVTNFLNEVLVGHTFTNLGNYIATNYIQHNPGIADGLASVQAATSVLAQLNYKPKKILAQGNFVLAMSEVEGFGSSLAVYDMWRIENGKLAEHWDIIETIPAQSTWQNNNGKF